MRFSSARPEIIHTTQPTLVPGSCDTLQARQMPVNPPAVREEKDTDEKEKEEQSRRHWGRLFCHLRLRVISPQ